MAQLITNIGFWVLFSQVKSSQPAVLEVLPTSKANGVWQFKAKLINNIANDQPLTIQVTSPVSQQVIEVTVQSELLISTSKCTSQPLQNMSSVFLNILSNFGLIISVLIALAAAIIGKLMW